MPAPEGYTPIGHPPGHPEASIWRTPTRRYLIGDAEGPHRPALGRTTLVEAVLLAAEVASDHTRAGDREAVRRVLWAWECAVPDDCRTGGRATLPASQAAWLKLHAAIQTAKLKLGPAPVRPTRTR